MDEPIIPLYTIGYGSRSLDEFIATLAAYEIAYLVDVRSAPYSRYKPEYAKDALAAALTAHGVRYLFLGDALGGRPSDPAFDSHDKVDYDQLKQSAAYQAGLGRFCCRNRAPGNALPTWRSAARWLRQPCRPGSRWQKPRPRAVCNL